MVTISGNTVTIVGSEITTITAIQEGDNNYHYTAYPRDLYVNAVSGIISGVNSFVSLYPNPVIQRLNITIDSKINSENITYIIKDIAGTVKKESKEVKSNDLIELELSDLNPGYNIIEITSNDKIYVGNFIKL